MWWVLFRRIRRTMYPLTVSIISDSEALYVPLIFPNLFLTKMHDARMFCAPVSWLIIRFTQIILLCWLAEQHPRCRLFGTRDATNPWISGWTLASKHWNSISSPYFWALGKPHGYPRRSSPCSRYDWVSRMYQLINLESRWNTYKNFQTTIFTSIIITDQSRIPKCRRGGLQVYSHINIVVWDVGVIFSCESAHNVPGDEGSIGAYGHIPRRWHLYFKSTKTTIRIEMMVLWFTHVALKDLIEYTEVVLVHMLHDWLSGWRTAPVAKKRSTWFTNKLDTFHGSESLVFFIFWGWRDRNIST